MNPYRRTAPKPPTFHPSPDPTVEAIMRGPKYEQRGWLLLLRQIRTWPEVAR